MAVDPSSAVTMYITGWVKFWAVVLSIVAASDIIISGSRLETSASGGTVASIVLFSSSMVAARSVWKMVLADRKTKLVICFSLLFVISLDPESSFLLQPVTTTANNKYRIKLILGVFFRNVLIVFMGTVFNGFSIGIGIWLKAICFGSEMGLPGNPF